jgi:hypothetical protein
MARGVRSSALERRREFRVPPLMADFQNHGIVRPGHDVRVLNLARGGVLVECGARLCPGTSTELQMFRGGMRVMLRACISRCRVTRLAPLVYEAALRFEQPLHLPEGLLGEAGLSPERTWVASANGAGSA